MKKITLIAISLLLFSCGSSKQIENSIQTGNYVQAFNKAIEKLRDDKNKSSNQEYIPLLKEAFDKAAQQDLADIERLKKLNDYKNIYSKYLNLDIRQDEVKALTPLFYNGTEMNFNFSDYANDLKQAQNSYGKELYDSGMKLMYGSKEDARKANAIFEELIFVNPNYRSDVSDLIKRSKAAGSTLVVLETVSNIKNYPISADDLLQFNTISTSNFDNKWVIIHNKKEAGYSYDYLVRNTLENIEFEPEKVNSELVKQEKKIQDGWKYVYDSNGNVAKDKDGNDMKQAKVIVVQAEVKLFQQIKASRVTGTTTISDYKNKSVIATAPLFGEAKFENVYAQYRGDQRAIEEKYYEVLQKKQVAFPKDEEFIKYSLADYKNKLTQHIQQQQF